jgi:5-enolpyruvylshikimate-3-phosphate synthase
VQPADLLSTPWNAGPNRRQLIHYLRIINISWTAVTTGHSESKRPMKSLVKQLSNNNTSTLQEECSLHVAIPIFLQPNVSVTGRRSEKNGFM